MKFQKYKDKIEKLVSPQKYKLTSPATMTYTKQSKDGLIYNMTM